MGRWDGKFFARMTQDTLSIYETPVRRVKKTKKKRLNTNRP